MKIMVASDIHGSAVWCARMLDRYRAEGAQRLVLLGDILYHGPRNDLPDGYAPKEVAAMLNALRGDILCVRGNCDSEVDQMMLDFPIMADMLMLYADDRAILATHGHVYNEDHTPPMRPGDILLHGHTHVPALRAHDDYVYCNPGSVAIPKEGSWHGCMLITDDALIWKTLDGEEKRRMAL